MRGYIEEFACTCNVHQKSKALLISSQSDGVKSLWKCLWSVIPDRIWNSEKPCISKDFLALCCTWFHRIGSTPKRKAVGSNPAEDAILSRFWWFFIESGFSLFTASASVIVLTKVCGYLTGVSTKSLILLTKTVVLLTALKIPINLC